MAAPTSRRPNSKSTNSCSRWQRWFYGVSKRRLAGTVGLFLMSVLSVMRMTSVGTSKYHKSKQQLLPPWTRGLLDIHHLQVGSSVSTFVITPDGATILIDAGDVNVPNTLQTWKQQGPPLDALNLKPPFPNDSKTPVGWILEYLNEFSPNNNNELDYLLLTHLHSDHMGDGSAELTKRRKSANCKYILSGISELVQHIRVQKIIDRGFPDYQEPLNLKSLHDASMDNYFQFVQDQAKKGEIHFEQFHVGSSQQIQMLHNNNHDFRVRVLKSGSTVAASFDATRPKDALVPTQSIPGRELLKENLQHGCENTMSAAFVIEYGDFRYYEGADQEIIRNEQTGEIIFDTIRPTARAAGKVDVATLNHHGHGVSQDYLDYMDPPIMILQGWSSDQPPNKSMELLAAASGPPRKIFATDTFQERLDDMGPSLSKLFQSTSGHVVVRVQHPPAVNLRGTERQTFEMIVLDGNRRVKKHYGRFPVRSR